MLLSLQSFTSIVVIIAEVEQKNWLIDFTLLKSCFHGNFALWNIGAGLPFFSYNFLVQFLGQDWDCPDWELIYVLEENI